MRCDLCGLEFDQSEAGVACASCPMAGSCHLVRCPRCGYEMPPEARLVSWLRGLRRGGQEARALATQSPADEVKRP